MRQIPGANLWIGNADDAANRSALRAAGIEAVVLLRTGEHQQPSTGVIDYLHVPLIDGTGNPPEVLRHLIDAVARLIRADDPTLICCSDSMSRSAAIAAAALALVQNHDLNNSLTRICHAANVDVSGSLWLDILAALGKSDLFLTAVKRRPSPVTPPSPPASPRG